MIAVLAIAGCKLGTFRPVIGGEADTLTEIATGNNSANLDFVVNSITSGALDDLADQLMTIDFDDGIVDLSGTTIPGLEIYPLATNATANGAYTRGTAITYTAEVYETGAGSTAFLTMDLTGVTAPELEVHMDAAVLTANGGSSMLDTQDDDVSGETEDDFIDEVTVTDTIAPAVVALGAGGYRRPQTTITPGAQPVAHVDNATTFTLAVTNLAGDTDGIDLATLNGAVTIQKLTAGVFADVAYTGTYAAGTFTMTLAAATVDGEVYKAIVNHNAIVENSAVNGYVHRADYDQTPDNTDLAEWELFDIGTIPILALGADNGGGTAYITLTGGSFIDLTTVTTDAIDIFVTYDHDNDAGTADIVQNIDFTAKMSMADDTVRLYLPANLNLVAGDSYTVVIQSTIVDYGADLVATGTDNRIYVDSTDEFGVITLTDTLD